MENFVDQIVVLVKSGCREAAMAMIDAEPDILDSLCERITDGGMPGGFEEDRLLTLDQVFDQASAL